MRSSSYCDSPLIDQKLIDAYNIYGVEYGGQRDYIYYDITPSNTPGTLCQNFIESIISFKFSPNYTTQMALNYIQNSSATDAPFPWTSGRFDFRVEAWIGVRNGNPITITKYFDAYPLELFDVTFVKNGNTYIPTFNGFRTLNLNMPVLNWDQEHYAEIMKISIWKMNPGTTVTRSYTSSGSTHTITLQISDLHLGDVLLSFDEPVITGTMPESGSGHTVYGLPDHSSGFYIFNIIPVKQ